jgi:hypothetical protein
MPIPRIRFTIGKGMLMVVVVAVVLALVLMTVRLSPRNDHFLESDGFIHDPINSPRINDTSSIL